MKGRLSGLTSGVNLNNLRILVRGGGDLASGVILRLHRAGWPVVVTELEAPLTVRRAVSFSQAVYDGSARVEEVEARRVDSLAGVVAALEDRQVPVLVDAGMTIRADFDPSVLIDGRMRKRPPETGLEAAALVIGLGPGFTAGLDCHAVIETNRGPFLGRVIWQGQAQPDTGMPERVGDYQIERVLRAPVDGVLEPVADIGALLQTGEPIARLGDTLVRAPFAGVLRGLVQGGLRVRAGDKIGDVDPRNDPRLSQLVSEKALAIGGGVLEAILSHFNHPA